MLGEEPEPSQITAIQPGRRRGRFNIYLNGEFALAVGEKVLADLGLKEGKVIEAVDLQTIAGAAERERAMQIALRYLEVRARSKREIEQRLYRSGIEGETTVQVIEKLKELNLLDDADFAQRWIESRSRSRPKGVRSLKSELALKGVSSDEIETATAEITLESEIDLAKAAIAKRMGVKRQLPADPAERDAMYRRLVTFLQRRGFGWSTIKAAIGDDFNPDGDTD